MELPPELLRRAKGEAAARGESLRALLTRAVAAELDKHARTSPVRQGVAFPLFGDRRGLAVDVTSGDVARALAADEAARATSARRRR